jgi:hypothetical protein
MPSTLNLILQFVILVILVFGILNVKRKRLNLHGYIALIAVALNALSIIVVMLPSASRIMAARALRWRFQTPGPTCWKMRGLMKVLAVLWTLSVLLGALVYYMLL